MDRSLCFVGQPSGVANNQPISEEVEGTFHMDTEDFNIEELRKCIKSFKNNKTASVDSMPIVVWKSGALELLLLNFCNMALNGERPELWVKSNIIGLPKIGDLGHAKNYSRITLTLT